MVWFMINILIGSLSYFSILELVIKAKNRLINPNSN